MIPNHTADNFQPTGFEAALITAFAEGFVYLAENGLLGEFKDSVTPELG